MKAPLITIRASHFYRLTAHLPSYTLCSTRARFFSTSHSSQAPNRIYESARNLPALQTTIALSTSSNRPLLALFSYTLNDRLGTNVSELMVNLLQEEKVGEREGGVGYVEVEMDAPDNVEVGDMYYITSIPTLLSFSRGEPQQLTKVTEKAKLQDAQFLRVWIENEAKRGGKGGAGGGLGGLLSGLFGFGGR